MKNKLLKIALITIIFVAIFALQGIFSNKTLAYTAHTADEAINWVKSKLNQGLDYDGYAGCQCVDLIMFYYKYLGVSPSSGNGCDYTWNALPAGWKRIQGAQPQKGDILVYTNGYGHVAIYESDYSHYHQNFGNKQYVQHITFKYNGLNNPYWGVIRPDFSTDNVAPTISEAFIDVPSMTTTSFTIKAKISDNLGISKVQFPTWTLKTDTSGNPQDDIIWYDAQYNWNTGYYEYTVNISNHNYEKGIYRTHIYAVDNSGNRTIVKLNNIPVGSTMENSLSNFNARIVVNDGRSMLMGLQTINGTSNNVVLKTKKANDDSQIWKFVKNNDGTYSIINSLNGQYLDIAGGSNENEKNVQTYVSNSTNAQKFYLMKYNDGYRIVPKCSGDLKAIDRAINSRDDGTNIWLYETQIMNNVAQTWYLEKITERNSLPFSDVKKKDWYFSSIEYVYRNGYVSGTTVTTFNPNTKVSRGNLVTILWRMAGSPKVNTSNKFSDVKSTDYYYDAVRWGISKGIINGYENGKFGPNNNATREQVATILMNYAKYRNKDISAKTTLNKFKDSSGVSSYAKNALKWAVEKKVMNGKENGTKLDPKGKSSRAEIAAMITNYCKNVGK